MQRYGEFLVQANPFSESPQSFSKQDFNKKFGICVKNHYPEQARRYSRKNSKIIWYFARLFVSLSKLEDRLHLENTKKIVFFFGILLILHYLCNMRAKNLYINIGLSVCKALIHSVLPIPISKNRLKEQTFSHGKSVSATLHLLLLAPAFSGRDFCVLI
jgi:hypothetical protein